MQRNMDENSSHDKAEKNMLKREKAMMRSLEYLFVTIKTYKVQGNNRSKIFWTEHVAYLGDNQRTLHENNGGRGDS